MLNSRHVAELIEKGDMVGIKESMDQSMTAGSQTFEQALYKLYKTGIITLEEATANADSANNLIYLINNDQSEANAAKAATAAESPGFDLVKSITPGGDFKDFTLKLD